MSRLVYAIPFGACLALGTASAADMDTATQLICATVEAIDCEAGASCLKGRPSEIGAPAFMRIDLERKTVAGTQRTTPIASFEKRNENVLLQGTESDFGWTMAIDTKAGTMAATLVNRDGAFVLFGSCTPL
jgi:hypothetical protein